MNITDSRGNSLSFLKCLCLMFFSSGFASRRFIYKAEGLFIVEILQVFQDFLKTPFIKFLNIFNLTRSTYLPNPRESRCGT